MYPTTKYEYKNLILANLFKSQFDKINSKLKLIINSQPYLKKNKCTGIYYKDSEIYIRKSMENVKYRCLPLTILNNNLKKELDDIYNLNHNLEYEYAKIDSILINILVNIDSKEEFKTFILKIFKSLDILENNIVGYNYSFKSHIEYAKAKPFNKETSQFFKDNPDSIKELTACYFKSKLMG